MNKKKINYAINLKYFNFYKMNKILSKNIFLNKIIIILIFFNY